MNVCRICLAKKVSKDISELQFDVKEENSTFQDVMMFCLDIKVSANSRFPRKLCVKCYNNVIKFHDFKVLALRNHVYLQNLHNDVNGIEKKFNVLRSNESNNGALSIGSDVENLNIKQEVVEDVLGNIKNEDHINEDDFGSDNELLSVIKHHKDENELKYENHSVLKRKRGRPKNKISGKADKTAQVCDECGKTVYNLRLHLHHHKPKSERERFPCKDCDKVFGSASARQKHRKFKHLNIRHTCDICHKVVQALRQHKLVVHNKEILPYPCVECDRRFMTRSYLNVHMRIHTKDKPFECDQCNNKFRTKVSLDFHIRSVHKMERTHLCQYCSKSFFKKYHLLLHIRTHTKEKPYKCEQCGKRFTTPTNLKVHHKRHTNIKTHQCTLCDKSFVVSGALTAHMVSHTKTRSHACKFCGYLFGRSDHRNRHERTAHLDVCVETAAAAVAPSVPAATSSGEIRNTFS